MDEHFIVSNSNCNTCLFYIPAYVLVHVFIEIGK